MGRRLALLMASGWPSYISTWECSLIAYTLSCSRIQISSSDACCCIQVVCTSCTTGQQLWKLPSRSRTKIIALQVVHHHQQRHHHKQQQQEHRSLQKSLRGRKRKQLQQQDDSLPQRDQMLLVCSASSHLTCWWLPRLATNSSGAGKLLLAVQNLQRQENSLENSTSPGPTSNSTCMACPAFGSSCIVFGNSDGSLTVAEVASSNSSKAAVAESEDGNNKRRQLQLRQPSFQTSSDSSSIPSTRRLSANASLRQGVQFQNAESAVGSHSDPGGVKLDIVRHCRLGKLSQILDPISRAAASNGVGHSSKERLTSLLNINRQLVESPLSRFGVRCMAFTGAGQLAIGLESGHVCILNFRHCL